MPSRAMLQGELAQEAPASGTADPIVSLAMSEHYRAAARDAGDHQVSLKKVHHADHVDMIEPPSPIWLQVVERIIEQCE